MNFDEKALQEQTAQIDAMREELDRLNSNFDAIMKDAGYTQKDLEDAKANTSPEAQQLINDAMEQAKRTGKARAAQAAPQSATANTGRAPGAGRRGVIRM